MKTLIFDTQSEQLKDLPFELHAQVGDQLMFGTNIWYVHHRTYYFGSFPEDIELFITCGKELPETVIAS